MYSDDLLLTLISACLFDALTWEIHISIGFYINAEYLMQDSLGKAYVYLGEYLDNQTTVHPSL